jgi:hypothetical protein
MELARHRGRPQPDKEMPGHARSVSSVPDQPQAGGGVVPALQTAA